MDLTPFKGDEFILSYGKGVLFDYFLFCCKKMDEFVADIEVWVMSFFASATNRNPILLYWGYCMLLYFFYCTTTSERVSAYLRESS